MDEILHFVYQIDASLNEDRIWRTDILPHISGAAPNVLQICQYGLSEIVNNGIEHSGSGELLVDLSILGQEIGQDASQNTGQEIAFTVADRGTGIFTKIQRELGLDDPRHAVLELVKGKYTSDPQRHSGEGIFFTSRIFDRFSIRSGGISFFAGRDRNGFLEEPSLKSGEDAVSGTVVSMAIRKDSPVLIADIFNEYTDPDSYPGFYRTSIPVKLMEGEGESLMSRSQARRLIARFDRFLEVTLDFSGVEVMGQGFADEIFRVFAAAHPTVNLRSINCGRNVETMIRHVRPAADAR
ncbi:MAG: STAS-like domain-containing protein [Treponema sp.]|jgi:anti-sigma regulatory factor (Ser/Thr protein kinase)|nr:STAS-like domain-containing protein [Treponema sp.]